jgi:hypothetical protein
MDFFVAGEELFVGLFFVAEEVALRLFTEVLAADFFFGRFLVCELLAEAVLLLDAVLLPELAAVWPKLAGTPSPGKEAVSRTRSAERTSLISFIVP